MNKEIYFAITGDVISSTDLPNRNVIQKKLINTCKKVNNVFKKHIINFAIIVGDEIQELVNKKTLFFEIVRYFERCLYPVKLRFGIGEGDISTSFHNTTALMDEECFINSREGIEKAKRENRLLKFILKDKKTENLIDTIILWIEKNKSKWNEIIYRRFYLYKELGSIDKVANKEKVKKQSIGKSLKRANYDLILKSEKIIMETVSTENG